MAPTSPRRIRAGRRCTGRAHTLRARAAAHEAHAVRTLRASRRAAQRQRTHTRVPLTRPCRPGWTLALPLPTPLRSPRRAPPGSNFWILNLLNRSLPDHVPVNYDVVRVPDSIWRNGTASKTVLNSYLLDTLGYDCILGGTIETPDAMVYSNTLHVHQTFGFVVVAPQPQLPPVPLVNELFMWVRPFSGSVWGITVLTFFISAALMAWFEKDVFEEELGGLPAGDTHRAHRLRKLLVHGLYVSFSTFTTQNAEGFRAHTLPGRIYRTVYAFGTLLTISCYVANLAAVLVTPPSPVALISAIGDFAANAVAACVLSNADHLSFMRTQYPDTKLMVVDSIYTSDLLRAVLDPSIPCAGAVAPDVMLYYFLGEEGDPDGDFCSLSITGQALNQGFYGITFNAAFPLEQARARVSSCGFARAQGGNPNLLAGCAHTRCRRRWRRCRASSRPSSWTAATTTPCAR